MPPMPPEETEATQPAGVELVLPMAALTAAGETEGETHQPEPGDAVAVTLEAKFVRAEGGKAVIRIEKANGEPVAEAPETDGEADEEQKMRALAEGAV
jgi:hypothetical protein